MGVTIDMRQPHLVRQHGDLLAVFTWMGDTRVLVLMPAYRSRARWFVVTEPNAHLYDNATHLAHQAALAVSALGMEESASAAFRIASIIHEALPDLITMPSKPPAVAVGPAYGEIHLRAEGEVLHSGLVQRDSDDLAPTYG